MAVLHGSEPDYLARRYLMMLHLGEPCITSMRQQFSPHVNVKKARVLQGVRLSPLGSLALLPPEIRNQIYGYILDDPELEKHSWKYHRSIYGRIVNLLLISRAIRMDCWPRYLARYWNEISITLQEPSSYGYSGISPTLLESRDKSYFQMYTSSRMFFYQDCPITWKPERLSLVRCLKLRLPDGTQTPTRRSRRGTPEAITGMTIHGLCAALTGLQDLTIYLHSSPSCGVLPADAAGETVLRSVMLEAYTICDGVLEDFARIGMVHNITTDHAGMERSGWTLDWTRNSNVPSVSGRQIWESEDLRREEDALWTKNRRWPRTDGFWTFVRSL